MRRHAALFLFGLGLLLLASGFVYDLVFAGIPYQDPTPAMSARYALHARIALGMWGIGGVAFLSGTVVVLVRIFSRRDS
jgi:hypothetical protein